MASNDAETLFSASLQSNNFDCLDEPVLTTSPKSSRKKRSNPDKHTRSIRKRQLHSGAGKVPIKNCIHLQRSFCKAELLTSEDISYNFTRLYDNTTKVEQDKDILSLMDISQSARTRVSAESRRKAKDITIKYNLLHSNNVKLEVCKATFVSVLGELLLISCAAHFALICVLISVWLLFSVSK